MRPLTWQILVGSDLHLIRFLLVTDYIPGSSFCTLPLCPCDFNVVVYTEARNEGKGLEPDKARTEPQKEMWKWKRQRGSSPVGRGSGPHLHQMSTTCGEYLHSSLGCVTQHPETSGLKITSPPPQLSWFHAVEWGQLVYSTVSGASPGLIQWLRTGPLWPPPSFSVQLRLPWAHSCDLPRRTLSAWSNFLHGGSVL